MTDNAGMPLIENAFAGIVITAQTFNPSIFTETWLAQNDIIAADALVGLRVFSAEVAQFQTSELQVLVMPPKIQMTFSIHGVSGDLSLPRKTAAQIVTLLPHTPYQALGLNFDFFVAQPSDQGFNAYNRALFGSGDCRLVHEFRSSDAKFGRYFSKDHGEARLKLDIKPVKAGPENRDLIQFTFNFHHDVAHIGVPKRAERLTELIGTWTTLREYAEHLVDLGGKT